MDFDFEEHSQQLSTASLGPVGKLVEKALLAKEEIDRIQLMMDEAVSSYKQIIEVRLPEAMDAVGCSKFRHDKSGFTVSVVQQLATAIAKTNQKKAFKWLELNDHGDLIKNEISIRLPRGDNDLSKDILDSLINGFGIVADNKPSVHPQTLKAWVKEQLEKGVDVPKDLFGIYQNRVAKIV